MFFITIILIHAIEKLAKSNTLKFNLAYFVAFVAQKLQWLAKTLLTMKSNKLA